MVSVIIPTEGLEQPAVATLAALVPGAAAGSVAGRGAPAGWEGGVAGGCLRA